MALIAYQKARHSPRWSICHADEAERKRVGWPTCSANEHCCDDHKGEAPCDDRSSFSHTELLTSNAKVSDGSQPPLTLYSSLSESAGSRSLHRLVGQFEALQM